MKLTLTIVFSFLALFAFAQQHNIPKDKWSKDFYISDEFCASKGLKPGETNNMLRVWNTEPKAGEKISRVVDIRYYFDSPDEAKRYLETNIPRLSENGDPVDTKMKIPGAENLRIFTDGEDAKKMNRALGLVTHYYILLFTVKNYACKVFVFSQDDIELSYAAEFGAEAAKRLAAAIK